MNKESIYKKCDENLNYDWLGFDYPIECCLANLGQWSYQEVLDPNCYEIYGKESFEKPSNEFLKEILDYNQFEKVYFCEEGYNDGLPWRFLVRHENLYYIFFEASCDYTGFDCQGGGNIYYTYDKETMWKYGITDYVRKKL